MSSLKKLTGISFSLLMVVAFVLFFTHRITTAAFWVIVLCCAAVGYIILPRWKE